MAKSKKSSGLKFVYDEPRKETPLHKFPQMITGESDKSPGIRARLLIEKALQSFEGINRSKLDELGISLKELATYRKEIRQALLAIIKEENRSDKRLRAGAIAYLGALKFDECIDLVMSIASDPSQDHFLRGYAIEALRRLKSDSIVDLLGILIFDPVYTVREKAIRALAERGSRGHIEWLRPIAEKDGSSELRRRAVESMGFILNGKYPEKLKSSKSARKMVTINESVERDEGLAKFSKPYRKTYGNFALWGGVNLQRNLEIEENEKEKPYRPVTYYREDMPGSNHVRLIVRGQGVGKGRCSFEGGEIYRIHENEMVLDLPESSRLKPGHSLGLKLPCDEYDYSIDTWVPDAPESPLIYHIGAKESSLWANEPFDLQVQFFYKEAGGALLLRVSVRMPEDSWKHMSFDISSEEIKRGEIIVPGFLSAVPGTIEVRAALYSHNGAACKLQTRLIALPVNPLHMYVSPSTLSTIGEGPAHYNSAENKFYCYANLHITNGYPHRVVLGPRITARVSDGGDPKDHFSFDVGNTTVLPNSTVILGIWMSFGGDTYDVFKNYGDVTIQLTLQTSSGDISGSAVWAAMAQIKLALNFVGNFSLDTRARLQGVVNNQANGILQQQNCYISESARFLLPADHEDFDRYRDIEMDDNKDNDCTAGSDEGDDLRDDWSSPNSGWLDVWLVESLSGPSCAAGVGGFSPVDGPTNKGDSKSGVIINMSSADLSTTFGRSLMGIIIAHEVGHFLGLEHDGNADNFMAAGTDGSNTDITHQQYLRLTDHGFVTRFVV